MYDVAVLNDQQHQQWSSSAGCFALAPSDAAAECWKFVDEQPTDALSRTIRFTAVDEGITVDATRLSRSLRLADGRELSSAAPATVALPCILQLGSTWIEVAPRGGQRALVPLLTAEQVDLLAPDPASEDRAGPCSATITQWLEAAGRLHRAAAGSTAFYADAARFAVETVGLDAAWVLTRTDDQWHIAASHLTCPRQGVRFDRAVLDFFQQALATWYQPQAEQALPAVVVAPVLDANGRLAAAIYGVRNTRGENRRRGIRPLEDRLVQLLAESVAVGMARLQQEIEAARTRVLLEHAFSPPVADYLQQHPESLSGQLREVTLLFADLRGYTALAERMSPASCCRLLGEVMEPLTHAVLDQQGTVVDYYGDGLLAMWNAPLEQSDHADRACTAAGNMLESLSAVERSWRPRLAGPLQLGIGIHTGPALVGNAGTSKRLKYGPRGHTVHMAQRAQAAAHQLRLPLVLTAATAARLSPDFFTLRVCTAKLPGLQQPTDLYTAYPTAEARRLRPRLQRYARALELFEQGDFVAAETLLEELLAADAAATPAPFLAQCAAAQKNGQQGRRAADRFASLRGSVVEILAK